MDRLARRIVAGQRSGLVRPVLEPLAALHRQSHAKADLALLQRAYDVAEAAHAGQKRKSGDPYITHPLAVATILAGLGMDTTTLVAALLHDTVEDTGETLEKITAEFGSEVAHLVDGVTKIDRVKLGDAAQAETIRKMIVAMARDPRVLVIKLADRLHNMRTLRFLPPEKQETKARETLEILAPLAHRLGMNTIKWELEDLAFATLYPKRYDEIVRLVAERAPSRDTYLAEVTSAVTEQLKAAKIEAVVTGRPKHYYSIYQKMIVRGRDFTDIWDLVGIRVLVDSVRDCYAALGIMHAHWQPVPGRFKDFVAMPKFNMYQSLHTTVIGPHGKPVELQIRTHDMHRTADFGIAAHWKYKEKARVGGKPSAGEFGAPAKPGTPDDMLWLRQLLDWQREAQEPGEFLETLRYDLGPQEVFVFTPKGDVISLPGESTPVDFAYAVHTEVGHHCTGARVNGSLVSLDSKLSNGDVVEIFTTKSSSGPSQDWLSFVGSSRARTKIRQWFTKERREDAVEAGKEALTRAMRKAGLPLQRLLGGEALSTLAKDLRYADVTALYAAVGEHQISAAVGRREADGGPRRGGGRGRGHRRDGDPDAAHGHPAGGRRRPGRRRPRDERRVGQARQVLHAGAGRRDPGLRHPRRRGQRAPDRLHQRRRPAAQARAAGRGRVGQRAGLGLPGRHPGRGAGPPPPALRRDQGAGRRAGEHPVRVGADQPRPGGGQPVHLRTGRPGPPRRGAADGAQRRRRLRRRARHRLTGATAARTFRASSRDKARGVS